MKRIKYKSGLLIILSALIFSATANPQELTKEFHKEYKAASGTTLELDNRYGDIVVQNWNENRIVIDVKITLQLPNREKAEKLISYIDVQFEEGNDRISAKTVIDEKFNFSGWGSTGRRFSIDYAVNMPTEANLEVANKYGNTDIAELAGYFQADIKYGNLEATKLSRGNTKPLSRISLAYGKADLDEAGWLDINVRYSGAFDIEKCQALLVDSKYSKLNIKKASSLVGNSKYDNIKIDEINNIVLSTGYTTVKVDKLDKKLEFEGKYGAFTADKIVSGFESIETDTEYMGVTLGIDEDASYRLDANVSYGSVKFDESRFNNTKHIVQNTSTELSGIVGKNPNPASKVSVKSSYGSVKLTD
jgi:hypothetical protein